MAKEYKHTKEPKKPRKQIDTKAIVDAAAEKYAGIEFPDVIFEGVMGEEAVNQAKADYLKNLEKEAAAEREAQRVSEQLAKRGIILDDETPQNFLAGAYTDAQKRAARREYARVALLEAQYAELRRGRSAVSEDELQHGNAVPQFTSAKLDARAQELAALADAHYQRAQERKARLAAESGQEAPLQQGSGDAQAIQHIAGDSEAVPLEKKVQQWVEQVRPVVPHKEAHTTRVAAKKIVLPKEKPIKPAKIKSIRGDQEEHHVHDEAEWAHQMREREERGGNGSSRF